MLEAGTIDLAMVEGTLLHQHLSSTQGKPFAPKVLTAMFPTPGMFVVRADSAFRSVADLRGHKVVFGAAGSGFVVLARYVLDGLGLDQQTDFDAVLLGRQGRTAHGAQRRSRGFVGRRSGLARIRRRGARTHGCAIHWVDRGRGGTSASEAQLPATYGSVGGRICRAVGGGADGRQLELADDSGGPSGSDRGTPCESDRSSPDGITAAVRRCRGPREGYAGGTSCRCRTARGRFAVPP